MNIKTLTYKEFIESTLPCQYVSKANGQVTLEKDEYYCLMVESHERTPYTLAIEPYYHKLLVGIEKTSGQNGHYISKGYNKRKNLLRGSTHIIKIKDSDIEKFCKLD